MASLFLVRDLTTTPWDNNDGINSPFTCLPRSAFNSYLHIAERSSQTMNILKSAMLVAGLGFASLANATTYDFSYTFDDGTLLSGSLSGSANGAFIQNISNVHVALNGNAFAGASLFAFGWNAATTEFNPVTPAVLSTNAALNNFIFADNNDPMFAGVTEYFYFVNDPASLGHEAFATNLNTGDIALDNPTNSSWSLVAAQVPEPGTFALLLPGLVLVGVSARRGQKRFNQSRS